VIVELVGASNGTLSQLIVSSPSTTLKEMYLNIAFTIPNMESPPSTLPGPRS
jgi:hypothetical protein